jgi:glycosyltransferase involved in cell wall biosynthesis
MRRLLRSLPGADRMRARLAGSPVDAGPPSGSKRPVVYLPTWVRWDSMRQRPQYLLQAFAAHGHLVYFVDPNEPAVRESDGVTIVPDLSSVPSRNVILYVHFAPMRHLFDSFEDPVIVYDILDDLSICDADEVGLPEERRVRAHHPHVMDESDLVIVSNPVLAETHRPEREDLMMVANGVDAVRFSTPALPPTGLPTTGNPVIGYHGMVSYWFDFDLFRSVAGECPDYDFVLVGPTDPRVKEEAAELKSLPNVHFLGERPSGDMPAYVQAFDVGTIWFKVNDLTKAVTPLKMYEYLAVGIGCVSTPLPACVDEPAVDTAESTEGYVKALAAALVPDAEAARQRRAAAGRADWAKLLEPVLERLESLSLDRVP